MSFITRCFWSWLQVQQGEEFTSLRLIRIEGAVERASSCWARALFLSLSWFSLFLLDGEWYSNPVVAEVRPGSIGHSTREKKNVKIKSGQTLNYPPGSSKHLVTTRIRVMQQFVSPLSIFIIIFVFFLLNFFQAERTVLCWSTAGFSWGKWITPRPPWDVDFFEWYGSEHLIRMFVFCVFDKISITWYELVPFFVKASHFSLI